MSELLTRRQQRGTIALVGIETLSLLIRFLGSRIEAEDALAAASLNLLSAGTILGMALIEHRHHVRTSLIFSLYLGSGAFVDATRSICCFHHESTLLGALATLAGATRFALLIIEAASRRGIYFTDDADNILDVELELGAHGQGLSILASLNPLFFASLGASLDVLDLGKLGPGLSSKLLHAKLDRKLQLHGIWRPHSLAKACLRTWNGSLMFCLMLRCAVTGFSVALPFSLSHVLSSVNQGHSKGGGALFPVGATAFLCAGVIVSRALANHAANSLAIRVRGGMAALIFNKHQKLTKTAAKDFATLNILQHDVESVAKCVPQAIKMIFALLDTCVCTYFLSHFVGASSYAMVVPLLTATISAYLFGRKIGYSLSLWNETIEKRIRKLSAMLAQLPAIRMIGLTTVVIQLISQLRLDELDAFKTFRVLETQAALLAAISSLLAPVVVITTGFFAKSLNAQLRPTIIFPALNLIYFCSKPLAALLQDYPTMIAMLASFDRIQTFLRLEERVDRRQVLERSDRDAVFRRYFVINSPSRASRVHFQNYVSTFAIQFDSVAITTPTAGEALYSDVNFSIEEGSITAVVGRRGSGRSLLLDSILGEVEVANGIVAVATDSICFAGQFTWLRDVSVRENIIGPLKYCAARFRSVIYCCLLQDDIKFFPGGDGYVVGVGGINLSGGQRQRIALARAVYADPSIMLLDDAFSSLDRRTMASILFRLCGTDGFLRQSSCTVIFASHLTECIDMADQYLCLDSQKGRITLELNDGTRGYGRVLNAPSTHVPEAVEAQQQEALHTVLKERKVSASNTLENPLAPEPRIWDVISSFLCPMGILNSLLWVLVVLAASAGEMMPGENSFHNQKKIIV